MVLETYTRLLQEPNWETLDWPMPSWMIENKDFLLKNQLNVVTIKTYLKYHDCGKWFCYQKDAQGRPHFKNHAQISAWLWLNLFGDEDVAELMARDMDFHLMKPSEVENYDEKQLIPTLLLASYCELISNSEMFGGFDEVSFKIKYKNLKKIGNNYFKMKTD